MAHTFSKDVDDEVFHRAKAGDRAAMDEILAKNQALVLWQAKRMTNTTLSHEEKVTEAYYGLYQAIRGFDPSRGMQFSTYATRAMWSKIRRASDEAALVGPGQKVVLDVRRQQRRKQQMDPAERSANDGCRNKVLASTCTGHDFSRTAARNEAVENRLLACLSPVEQEVIRGRFFDDLTLREVGEIVGVTKERIRQIEAEALDKLRSAYAGAA